MIGTYNIEVDNEYKNLIMNWNKAYPPSEAEVKIHNEIAKPKEVAILTSGYIMSLNS